MFTGLVEGVGHVRALTRVAGGWQLRLSVPFARELTLGESVAVNGVCLTVTGIDGDQMSADIGPETVRVTTLGDVASGQTVNLERSMRADSRVGGHFVQGHVDGTGTVVEVRADGDAHWVTVEFPPVLAPFLIRKGSIAVDGISLTIADLRDDSFTVMIVPFTWGHTNLASVGVGDQVNLECDLVGKYVARTLELRA